MRTSVIHLLNGPDRITRFNTTVALSRIHERPDLVIPALISSLSFSNVILPTTINALSSFGEKALPAVPQLLSYLTDSNECVREAATNALKSIDPDNAERSGVH